VTQISILHTCDLHGRLSKQAAEKIHQLKQESTPSLLLDSGDAVSAGNIGVKLQGEETLRRMSICGYDALAVGNREFHPIRRWMQKKIADAAFPMLCANLCEPKPDGVRSYQLFNLAGHSIAVFGLCVPMITRSMWARKISPFVFDDPIETAVQLVPSLRKEASIVIAITHIGLEKDRQLAAAVPGIDLILSGHSHTPLDAPEGDCPPILQAGFHGSDVGRAVIERTNDQTRLISWERIPL
jgi:5'-nucleotidase